MKKSLFLGIILAIGFFLILPVFAQTIPLPLNPELTKEIQGQAAQAASIPLRMSVDQLQSLDIRIYIASVIRVALTAVGIIFIGLMFFGGVRWIFSGGNEENIKKAKSVLVQSTVGLLLILASYGIALAVEWALIRATTEDVFWKTQEPRLLSACGDKWTDYQNCQTSGFTAKEACDKKLEAWNKCVKDTGWGPTN